MLKKQGIPFLPFVLLVILIGTSLPSYAQNIIVPGKDTATTNTSNLVLPADTSTKSKVRHSPKKAAILALAAPGAGQIYNRKYWKLPIVYAGFAGLGYWIGRNANDLNGYKNAYRLEVDDDPTTIGSFRGVTGEGALDIKLDRTKTSLDISIIAMTAWYALSIVDATVDAHLFDYSINEDIRVSLKPQVGSFQAVRSLEPSSLAGLTFTLHLNHTN